MESSRTCGGVSVARKQVKRHITAVGGATGSHPKGRKTVIAAFEENGHGNYHPLWVFGDGRRLLSANPHAPGRN